MHSAVLDFVPPILHHPGHLKPRILNPAERDADVLFPVLVQLRDLGVPEVLGVQGVLGVAEASPLDLVATPAHQGVVLATLVDLEEVLLAIPDHLQQQS